MKLQIDERVRPIGPWADESAIHHCVHLLEKGSSLNTFAVVSLPERDIERAISPFSDLGARVKSCIPHVAAIAALTGRLTDEPVIACFMDRGYVDIIAAEKGIPFYSQISPIDEEIGDPEIMAQAIFNVRQIINSRFNKNVKKLLLFGKKNYHMQDQLGSEKIWRPDTKKIVKEEHQDLFWLHPELVGSRFTDKDFNCVPTSLKNTYVIQDINRVAAALALCGIIVLSGSGFYLKRETTRLRARYNLLKAKVQEQDHRISKKMPDAKVLERVAGILKVKQAVSKEPSLDDLLYKISGRIPDAVAIEELKAKREELHEAKAHKASDVPPPESFTGQLPAQEKDVAQPSQFFQMPLVVSLKLTSIGTFQQVKARLEKAAQMLGNDFSLSDISLEYKEANSLGRLECRFVLRGGQG